jgi:hypothetical protein
MSNVTTLRAVAAKLKARGFPTTRHTLRKGCQWYQIPIDVQHTGHNSNQYIIFKTDARRLEQIYTGTVTSSEREQL